MFSGITNKNSLDPVPSDPSSVSPSAIPTTKPPSDIPSILRTLDTQLRTLYTVLPPRTALVLFTGHGDPRRMVELNARKTAFESMLRMGKNAEEIGKENRWTMADGRELEAEVEKAKRGLLFLSVKDVT